MFKFAGGLVGVFFSPVPSKAPSVRTRCNCHLAVIGVGWVQRIIRQQEQAGDAEQRLDAVLE